MSRTRARVVFLLVILILLVVSALLGLLSWWLGQAASSPSRGAGGELQPADAMAASAFPIIAGIERWTG
jgi:hypothetical protein